ncbi:heavy-metal-associated domain-containing protein [Cellulosilyticum sp. ST5]|uniref:heavy-metal-associated domain-containing protein n=1 Tax=unclassified Cellulosilyticum TaxID=2643091 RepID=UPI000F8EC802|nr:heavy-metal-associated domain-containing protein [Cellulosilyticum sp. WCF-2]QEH68525.1 heavy-metal-associated domain-containing protein [Cellulosilyticum sp. WCF-2]
MHKVHYNVSGLQNSETKTQVKNALSKIDGVSMVNVDLGECSIEVGFNDSTNESTIKACIENTGCQIE